MVTITFTPLACAVVTTTMFVLTFYAGRWIGIKTVMNRIEDVMKEFE